MVSSRREVIAMGSAALIGQVKVMRTILGSNSDPDTAWLIQRSLGTLQLRDGPYGWDLVPEAPKRCGP